jgi:hypothetical protein
MRQLATRASFDTSSKEAFVFLLDMFEIDDARLSGEGR